MLSDNHAVGRLQYYLGSKYSVKYDLISGEFIVIHLINNRTYKFPDHIYEGWQYRDIVEDILLYKTKNFNKQLKELILEQTQSFFGEKSE